MYHQLVVTTSNLLKKLFLYYKSISTLEPFLHRKAGMLSYLSSILSEGTWQASRTATTYIRLHAIILTRKSQETFDTRMLEFLNHLGGGDEDSLESYYISSRR